MVKSILFDSSVWISALTGQHSPQARFLAQVIAAESFEVCITPTILQEVLQGVRNDEEFARLERQLRHFPLLHLDPVEAAVEAAQLFRTLRKKGVTIRKPNDCLIAVYALRYGVPLCHRDADFDHIATHTGLRIFAPSV
jgi:predicted nucleic acid-binding protein